MSEDPLSRGRAFQASRTAFRELELAFSEPDAQRRERKLPFAIGQTRLALDKLAEVNKALREVEAPYDSRPETYKHIRVVGAYLAGIVAELHRRAAEHDRSKLEDPELAMFDEYTPKLRETVYGTPEYAAVLEAMGPALVHHYEANRHHPEHFLAGYRGMNLIDVIEMLVDWKAASERQADGGNIGKSIHDNAARFGYGHEFEDLLVNTAAYLGWL